MINQQTLILDLDDTLIHCNKYFNQSRKEFVKQIKKWFKAASVQEIRQKQLEIDLKSVKKVGLHSSGSTESLVATYKFFCKKYKRKLKLEQIKKIHAIGERVFETKVEPLPYMYEVLDKLQEDGHDLYLFTGGDVINQHRKIAHLELERYFQKGIFIFEHKNTEALKKVLDHIKSPQKTTWMIGNSLKTDIKPAIELGINAIYIPSDMEWIYNIIDLEIEPNGIFAELPSLKQLPEFLMEQTYYSKRLSQSPLNSIFLPS